MKVAIISPCAGLVRYSALSNVHLVLAQIIDPVYVSFYLERRRVGDTLILNNGAHDTGQSGTWNILEDALTLYRPQICVLPDTLNNPSKTVTDSLRFLDKNIDKFPETQWMYVVQESKLSNCHTNWFSYTKRVLEDLRVGSFISCLGITRYLTINYGLSRVQVSLRIRKELQFEGKFHALGMVNGDLSELDELRNSNLFDTIDTSVPVWRGWNGYFLSSPLWTELSCDFSTSPTNLVSTFVDAKERDIVIRKNLGACGIDTSKLRIAESSADGRPNESQGESKR